MKFAIGLAIVLGFLWWLDSNEPPATANPPAPQIVIVQEPTPDLCDAIRDPYERYLCAEERYWEEQAEQHRAFDESYEAEQTWQASRYDEYEDDGVRCYPMVGCE